MGKKVAWTCPDCGMSQEVSPCQDACACAACGCRLEGSDRLWFARKAIVDLLGPAAGQRCSKGAISQRVQTRLGELGLWKKLPGDYAELSVCDLIVAFLLMQEKGWLEELAEMPIESVKPSVWRSLEIEGEPLLSACEAFVNGTQAAIKRMEKAIKDDPKDVALVESFFASRGWKCDAKTQDAILVCLSKGAVRLGKSAAETVKKFSVQTKRMLWQSNRKIPGLDIGDFLATLSLDEMLRMMKEDNLPSSCLEKFPFSRLTQNDWIQFLSTWSGDLPDKVIEQMTPLLSSFSKDEIGRITRANTAMAKFFPAASLPADVFVDYFKMNHADKYFSVADFNALSAAQWERLCRESSLNLLRRLPLGALTTDRLLTLLSAVPALVPDIPDTRYARMSAQELYGFLARGQIHNVPAAMTCMARVAVPRLTQEMKDRLVSCYRGYLAIIPVYELSEGLFVSLYLGGRASERSYFTKEAFEEAHLSPAAWTRLLEGCGGVRVPPLAEEFLMACTPAKRQEIFFENFHLLFKLGRFLTGQELNAFGLAAWGKICQAASREELKRLPFAELDFAHFHRLLVVRPDVIADVPETCYTRFDPAETAKLLRETKLVETASLHAMIETVMLPRLTSEERLDFLRSVLKSSRAIIPAFVEKEFARCDPAFRMELFKNNPSLATRLDRVVLADLTNEEFLFLCDRLAGARFLFEVHSPKSLAHEDQVKLLARYPLRAEFFDWKGWSLPDVCAVTSGAADNIALRREYPHRMKLGFYRHRKILAFLSVVAIVIAGYFAWVGLSVAHELRLKAEAESLAAAENAKTARANADVEIAEKNRKSAEANREKAEADAQTALELRQKAEAETKTAEANRQKVAEEAKTVKANLQKAAAEAKTAAENAKAERAKADVASAEKNRQEAEAKRHQAELDVKAASELRRKAEAEAESNAAEVKIAEANARAAADALEKAKADAQAAEAYAVKEREKAAFRKAVENRKKEESAAKDAEKRKRDAEQAAEAAEKRKRKAEEEAEAAKKAFADAEVKLRDAENAAWLEDQKCQKAKRDADKAAERRQRAEEAAEAAEKRLRKAQSLAEALESDEKSLYKLGNKYYDDWDYANAAECYRMAAAQGDLEALNNLGLMYLKGEGVVQSDVLAADCFRRAARRGNARARRNLDWMYKQGRVQDF